MGEYRITELLETDRVDRIRAKLEAMRERDGCSTFLFPAGENQWLFRSANLSSEKVKQNAEEALALDRSDINELTNYDS
jgi:hypothetical protein